VNRRDFLRGWSGEYMPVYAVAWYYSPKPLSDGRRARVIAEVVA